MKVLTYDGLKTLIDEMKRYDELIYGGESETESSD